MEEKTMNYNRDADFDQLTPRLKARKMQNRAKIAPNESENTLKLPKFALTLDDLTSKIGKKVFVMTPGFPEYGRFGVVEGVSKERNCLYLENDYTCCEYGKTWVAFPEEAFQNAEFMPGSTYI